MFRAIIHEIYYAKMCLYTGILLALCYDFVRVLRKSISNSKYLVIVSDLLYGVFVGVYIFLTNYENNDGVVRIFVFLMLILGIFLYKKFSSNFVVMIISTFLKKIRKIIQLCLRIVGKIPIKKSIRWKKYSKFRKL